MSEALVAEKKRKAGPGRPKGSSNKITKEVRAIAAVFGPAAVRRLAVLGGLVPKGGLREGEAPAKSEATQAVCLGMVLNRAFGFPSQPMQHSADESFEALLDRLDARRPAPKLIETEVAKGSFEIVGC